MLRQTNAALANLKGCLNEAGVNDLKSLIKVTVYITDLSKLPEVRTNFFVSSLQSLWLARQHRPEACLLFLTITIAAASSMKRSKHGREMRMQWCQRGLSCPCRRCQTATLCLWKHQLHSSESVSHNESIARA